ncbi:MAG: cell division ATP-binding protein FtsE [Candidatus Binatia bacterium]
MERDSPSGCRVRMIRLNNISKVFGGGSVAAVEDVSLSVEQGEFVLITGPSGAGKTTLLKIIFGDEVATSGTGVVNGRNLCRMGGSTLAALRREMGLVFQDPRLIERMTVGENIALAAEVAGATRGDALRRSNDLLQAMALWEHRDTYPSALASGERQRVSLARALANDPVLLLADEPTGNLDPDTSSEILELLRLVNGSGTTVLMATHDMEALTQLCCRMLVMKDGRIVDDSTVSGPLQ